MNPIICVTEFSEHSVAAARAAAALAHRMGGSPMLVRSVDERGQFSEGLRRRLTHEDRPRLAQEAERLRQLGLVFDDALLRGVPDDGIVKFATERKAQLVVVGCSPIGAMERWLLGCTAELIAESSPVPTLALRSAGAFEGWAYHARPLRVLLGLDLTLSSDAALRWLGGFCQLGLCTVLVEYIADPQAGADGLGRDEPRSPVSRPPCSPRALEKLLSEKVTRVLGDQHVRVDVAVGTRRVDEDLITLASRSETDLLVVGTHQWRGLERLYHHSVSRGVLRRAAMNVLCVPAPGVEQVKASSADETHREPPGSAASDPTPLPPSGTPEGGVVHPAGRVEPGEVMVRFKR